MKITLTQDDLFLAVREYLTRQGFEVPPPDTELFGLFYDEPTNSISIEVDGIRVHAVNFEPPAAPASARGERFAPLPSPPRQRKDVPDRSLDESEPLPERFQNERSIKTMVAQSQEFVRRIPDPARVQHQPAREQFGKIQVAPRIEDFGKDPEDFKDEI